MLFVFQKQKDFIFTLILKQILGSFEQWKVRPGAEILNINQLYPPTPILMSQGAILIP